jgi:hypothetical protein
MATPFIPYCVAWINKCRALIYLVDQSVRRLNSAKLLGWLEFSSWSDTDYTYPSQIASKAMVHELHEDLLSRHPPDKDLP